MAVPSLALALLLSVNPPSAPAAGAAPGGPGLEPGSALVATRGGDLGLRPLDVGTSRSTIPRTMPRLDGPFSAGELVGAGAGVLVGDLAVVGLAYGTLQLFANGTIAPTASNFRNAAYVLAASAILLPPLGAMLGGALARSGPSRGHPWKAFALSLAGHAASLVVAYLASPHYWALFPAQLATMTTGTTVGLHWGRAPRDRGIVHAEPAEPSPGERAARDPGGGPVAFLQPPMCLDRG